MKTYSRDFRERALALLARDHTVAQVAALLGIGTATLKRWRRLEAATGSVAPRPKPGRPSAIDPTSYPAVIAQVRATPDATLAEHCATWETTTGLRVSPATLCRLLQRLDLPLKKNA